MGPHPVSVRCAFAGGEPSGRPALHFSTGVHIGQEWISPSATDDTYLVFQAASGNLAVVPEPSPYAMTLAGLACGGYLMRCRRKRA